MPAAYTPASETRLQRRSGVLIERVVLTPGVTWGETDAQLVGDFGTILEWTGAGDRQRQTGA